MINILIIRLIYKVIYKIRTTAKNYNLLNIICIIYYNIIKKK